MTWEPVASRPYSERDPFDAAGRNATITANAPVSPRQWDDIRRRYLEGESASSLALEFGVSAGAIRRRIGAR